MYPQPRKIKLLAKKNRILNEVFRNDGCSRFDLARRLNINAAMVGTYVAEFVAGGMLVEGETSPAGRGRAPVPLQLNPKYGCFLGLDFEALRARAVLCDFAGNALLEKETPFRSRITRKEVLRKIVALAQQLADRADRPLLSVGVAAPGQVDCNAGHVLHYGLLPDFDEVPLLERFQRAFEAPVFVEDNIRAVAYGELLRGAGRGHQNFLCLAVRSGVGLGIVVGGKRDVTLGDEIIAGLGGRAANLAGRTTPSQLAAVLSGCDLLIGIDSGPMHVAAAMGRPVVGLFGPTNPYRTGPQGEGHQVIFHRQPCWPCMTPTCADRPCMSAITVEEVLAAAGRGLSPHLRAVRRYGDCPRSSPPL